MVTRTNSNDPRVPLNYRGISLLSVPGKLYAVAISHRVSKYLKKHSKLADEQNGIRPDRSCLDHIFSLYNLCQNWKNLKLETFVTFIDYQKAFNFVNHTYLYHKLINIGITGNIYFAIKSIYSSPKSCVQLNGRFSDWFHVSSGVRQGDSLSPVLFSVFINDLATDIRNTNAGVNMGGDQISLFMYTDDIALVSGSVEGAQRQLDAMTQWCNKWQMRINAKKSQIMHIRHHQRQRCKTPVTCCGQALVYAEHYKYLGY